MTVGMLKRGPNGKLLRAMDGKLKRCDCCQGGPCTCNVNDACTSEAIVESRIEYSLGQPPNIVYEREALCCCDAATVHVSVYTMVLEDWTNPPPNVHDVRVETEGSGTNPVTMTDRRYVDGALVQEQTRQQSWGCHGAVNVAPAFSPPTPPPPQDGQGVEVTTCSETYGWSLQVTTFGDPVVSTRRRYWVWSAVFFDNGSCSNNCWACCLPGGECINTDEEGCDAEGGTFHDGERCGDPDVECRPQTGACCVGGDCIEFTREQCDQAGGFWFGVGFPCAVISQCPESNSDSAGGGVAESLVAQAAVPSSGDYL